MSIAGGFAEAVKRGSRATCDVVQVFTTAPGNWARKKVTKKDAQLMHCAEKECGVRVIAAHAIYLINIASCDATLRKKSIQALIAEVNDCETLGIPFVVLHPGSGKSGCRDAAIARAGKALSLVLEKTNKSTVKILLETTAGSGNTLGFSFEELAKIRKAVSQKRRVAYCLDTCHLFTAGYDFRTKKGYEKVVADLDRVLGIRKVSLFHLNDSQHECGTRKDRHEHIGKGRIGTGGFRHFVGDRRFEHVPAVLETPKGKDLKEDIKNLGVLRKLA